MQSYLFLQPLARDARWEPLQPLPAAGAGELRLGPARRVRELPGFAPRHRGLKRSKAERNSGAIKGGCCSRVSLALRLINTPIYGGGRKRYERLNPFKG